MNKRFVALWVSLLLCSLVCSCIAASLPYPFKVLPLPQNIELVKSKGLALAGLDNIFLKGGTSLPVLGDQLSRLRISNIGGKGSVTLYLDKTIANLPSDEGYLLTITGDHVEITAKGEAGLFYGCQTLEQIMEDARDFKKPLPACKITDYPTLTYRAVHFDVKHHLDHMNYYYKSIDRLARYKINAIVFEFEDKLRYQLQPLVGAPHAISIDEMAALTKYAKERFIEITPLVQGLGHATFILKHEAYSGLRELSWNHWAFCPLNEGTYQVLFDLYRDAIKATPGSKYLHIGGDEIGNIGLCPRCKPTADKEGMMALNLYWLKRVCDFAKENNRVPIFWDDMPLQHAGLYRSTWNDEVTATEAKNAWEKGVGILDSLQEDFPKNCVYMRWNYSMANQPGNILALDWYKKNALHAMIATATNAEGGMLFQEDVRDKGMASAGIISIQSFIRLAAKKNISGMLCTAWDDKSPHMENYWRGFIAAAEFSWSPDGRNLDEYDEAWSQREFGSTIKGYTSLSAQLRAGSELWYEGFFNNGNLFDDNNGLQSMKQVEHWLKPLAGQEFKQFDYKTKLITLPDLNQPGAWRKKYSDRLQKAAIELKNAPVLTQKLVDLKNNSIRNTYYWRLCQAMYQFQLSTPKILIALEQCDQAEISRQKSGLENLRNALLAYHDSWSALKAIYSETRFISNPSNDIPDRYFHLASQREDLSWMVQAQELFEEMINKWLPK